MTESKVTLQFLKDLFQNIDNTINVESFEESIGSKRGDNYTAELYRILARGTISKNHPDITLVLPWQTSLIYKCLPENPTRREAFKSVKLFRNEVSFYTRVVPLFEEFLSSREHTTREKLAFFPICYRAAKNEIILEDLKARNFEMADRKQGLNLRQLTSVLENLAKFHAISLALKIMLPEEFYALLDPQNGISECLFVKENEEWYREYYKNAISNITNMIRTTLSDNPKRDIYVSKFSTFGGDNFFQTMIDLVVFESPLSVLCHGDCWTNNLLFKNSRTETEVCFIDFQLCRYGSLALDLANLFYCCTTRKLRDLHLGRLLTKYHSIFIHNLQKLLAHSKFETHELTDREYLYTLLLAEFKRCALFGLGLAIDILPISTCDSEDAPDMYEGVESGENSNVQPPAVNELCSEKMVNLICEFVDNSLL